MDLSAVSRELCYRYRLLQRPQDVMPLACGVGPARLARSGDEAIKSRALSQGQSPQVSRMESAASIPFAEDFLRARRNHEFSSLSTTRPLHRGAAKPQLYRLIYITLNHSSL